GAPAIWFSMREIAENCLVSYSSAYRIIWRLQMMGAVRAHGRNWSRVAARWRHGPELIIDQLEATINATPTTTRLLDKGKNAEAREMYKIERSPVTRVHGLSGDVVLHSIVDIVSGSLSNVQVLSLSPWFSVVKFSRVAYLRPEVKRDS